MGNATTDVNFVAIGGCRMFGQKHIALARFHPLDIENREAAADFFPKSRTTLFSQFICHAVRYITFIFKLIYGHIQRCREVF